MYSLQIIPNSFISPILHVSLYPAISHFDLWKNSLAVTTYHLLLSRLIQLKPFSMQLWEWSKTQVKSYHLTIHLFLTPTTSGFLLLHQGQTLWVAHLAHTSIWHLTTTLAFHLVPLYYPDTLVVVHHFSTNVSFSQTLSIPGQPHLHSSHQVIPMVH